MLVLIVVSAATALSLFIASYQKQVQAEENQAHLKSLESLHVITVETLLNTSVQATAPGTLQNVTFNVESLDVNQIILTGIDIDNQAVRNYSVTALNLTAGTYQTTQVAALGIIYITPDEQFQISVATSPGPASGFYDSSFGLLASSYIQIDLFTYLANDFRAAFLPPTAIALVTLDQTINASGVPQAIPILDGMNSVQPGQNSSIVSWDWSVDFFGNHTPALAFGEETEAPFNGPPDTTYNVTLTVTNNFGLIGVQTVHYLF